MTSKEMLERVRTAMIEELGEQKTLYDPGCEPEDIKNLNNDIKRVMKVKTVGEIGTMACDQGWGVDAWMSFLLSAILDDTKYIGDIPDHWST